MRFGAGSLLWPDGPKVRCHMTVKLHVSMLRSMRVHIRSVCLSVTVSVPLYSKCTPPLQLQVYPPQKAGMYPGSVIPLFTVTVLNDYVTSCNRTV